MKKKQLFSPQEEKKINRYLQNIKRLSNKSERSSFDLLVMHAQCERLMKVLGAKNPDNPRAIDKAFMIIEDFWPYKKSRLKKLAAQF